MYRIFTQIKLGTSAKSLKCFFLSRMTIEADLMGSGGWWCHTQVHFFLAVKVQEAFCVKKVNLGMLGLILKEQDVVSMEEHSN